MSENTENDTEMPRDSGTRQLCRTHEGRMIAGVCSGIGQYTGIDPNIIRLGLGILTIFGGAGVLAYLVAWLLIPEEGSSTSIVQDFIDKRR